MSGTRDAASSWERDRQEHVKKAGVQLGHSSKNMFRQEKHQVSGMTHGNDFVLTGPTERLTEKKLISYGSTEGIKADCCTGRKRAIVHQHDPRHFDVLAKDLRNTSNA